MTILAAIGQSDTPDTRQAASQATHQALDQLGRAPAVAGLIFAAHDHPTSEIINGASSLLGNLPLFGFTTSTPVISSGPCERSIVVVLLAGNEIQARAAWSPVTGQGRSSDDPTLALQKIIHTLQPEEAGGLLLIAGDGLSGRSDRIGELLTDLYRQTSQVDPIGQFLSLAGCLSEADIFEGRTFQIGGLQTGSGGLSGALISGKLALGIGAAHSWRPVGKYYRITRSNGPWIRSLDYQAPTEVYASLFGRTARDWCFPPLNSIVRMYPLGIEKNPSDE